MPFLLVNSTESLQMDMNVKEETKKPQNKNATTELPGIKTALMSNNVLTIILLTMGIMFVIALCAFCYSCFLRKKVLHRHNSLTHEPNAPNRKELEEAYKLQRRAMLDTQKEPVDLGFTIFQSESSFRASLSRWASVKNLPGLHSYEHADLRNEKQPTSYATTPRSVFTTLSRKLSANSAKRIEHLRTKLVARFPSSSSHSTSDISVFFSTSSQNSEWGECSQLGSGEDKDTLRAFEASKSKSKSKSVTKSVPSIVIEFVN